MPLDQAAAAFIENAASKPSKPLSETSVAQMRESVDALIPLGFEREEVHAVEDWVVDGVAVRSYVPGAQSLGNVVYLHGGSFTRCGLHTHDTLCRRLANRSGCTVVAVEFSLAPEATYPRQLDEVAGVVAAVSRSEPGQKLFVAGESSGGCLAAATTLRAHDRGTVRVDGLMLLLPVLDRDSGTPSRHALNKDYLLTDEQMDWMFEQYAPNVGDDDPLVFPFRAPALHGFPPTVVVTAEFDPLRDEGRVFAERIRAAGGHAEYVCVPGIIHHAPLVPKQIPAGARVVDDAGELLRELASSTR
ncbi:alpha/beta hydrolase [Sciscionella marina]|uniref:alpha/beta hydrolase n=1 Tax=Sciscionella marina TaxID=508770 RepID=UPI000377621A|nr:alpha/beta hydrolase [Sciscionella marina]